MPQNLLPWLWIVLATGALVVELHAQTAYLLVVAAALYLGGGLGLAGSGIEGQLIAIALVAAAGFPLAEVYRRRQPPHSTDEADIGQDVEVIAVGPRGIRVAYRGTEWDAKLPTAAATVGERLRIAAVQGNTLVLRPPSIATERTS